MSTISPISFHAACRWITATHRHLRKPPAGWLFGVALVAEDGAIVGVACAGRPCRLLQDGRTCEITRVATAGEPNACSQLYGALLRAAKALGYTRVVTYTREDEPGTSPRAAGFLDDGPAGGGEWSRPSRARGAAEDPSPKRRWIWRATGTRG